MSSVRQRELGTYVRYQGQTAVITKRSGKTAVPWSPSLSPQVSWKIPGSQRTYSENHPDWKKRRVSSDGDAGGEFTSTRQYIIAFDEFYDYTTDWFPSTTFGDDIKVRHVGPVCVPIAFNTAYPPFMASSQTALMAKGTTAIASCSPVNPVSSAMTALLDTYHDGLPHLLGHRTWRDRSNLARSAGDEYLNVEFGWLPLVNDVTSFARGVLNLTDVMRQFTRDSGSVVRRRFTFPPVRSVESVVLFNHASVGGLFDRTTYDMITPTGSLTGQVFRDREISIDTWFSGAFTYHAPSSFLDVLGKHAVLAEHVLGLDLNPEVMWDLAPWSWAVDWFSNAGDVIHNVNNYITYGQVLKYAYIMEHSVVRDTYSFGGGLGLIPQALYPARPNPIVFVSETKLRRRATPFGFGISLGGLNSTQKTIVAALGLSRL